MYAYRSGEKIAMGLNLADVAALLTAITALLIAYNSRRKIESEAQGAATVAYTALIEPLVERINRLERELKEERQLRLELEIRVRQLHQENQELLTGVKVLIQQISDLGTEPNWRPKENKNE